MIYYPVFLPVNFLIRVHYTNKKIIAKIVNFSDRFLHMETEGKERERQGMHVLTYFEFEDEAIFMDSHLPASLIELRYYGNVQNGGLPLFS